MLKRQTVNLAKAALLLHTIKADKNRLDLVLELQRFLVRRIVQGERRIVRINQCAVRLKRTLKRDRLAKEDAKRVKASLARCADLGEQLRHLLFVWRCFGDGIAATYQDKYALKHLYYDAHYNVKESPGFLSGKIGFRREWKLLRKGIQMGVPVVLADLTNIVRHGDLCALAGRDPLPVEVKSSGNRNARTARQFAQLSELAEFYANDGATSFRGTPNVRREALRLSEVNHFEAANACVTEALQQQFATVQPEPGLRYLAMRTDNLDDRRLGEFVGPSVLAHVLTPSTDWLPAYPFTLSLHPHNLVPFLQHHVAMLVLVDLAYLKALFTGHGVHATIMMDGFHAIQLCQDPTDLYPGVIRVSHQKFGRVAGEFQSLAWFAEETARAMIHVTQHDTSTAARQGSLADSDVTPWEIPPDWYRVRDCF